MPTYELTSPNGEKYRVTAPEGASEKQVMAYFQSQMSSQSRPQKQRPQQGSRTQEQPESNMLSPLMQGLTFGWADELGSLGARIGAGLAGAPEDRRDIAAKRELDKQRAVLSATRADSPWTSTGLEIAGSLAPGLGAAKLATSGMKLLGIGLGEGAVAGAGSAEGGLTEKAVGAGLGGAAGGLLAGAVPVAGYMGSRAASGISDIVSRIREQPTTRAGKMLSDWMQTGGMTPAKLKARARQLGPDATVAEAGGAAGMAMGQGLVGEPTGQARILAERELGKRLPGMGSRVREAVRGATGVKERLLPVLDEINARQRSRSNTAYKAAYAVPVKPDDDLINILNRPSVRKALPLAMRGAADEGRALPQIEKIVMQGDDVRVGRENIPDMEALDHIKRTLDDMVSAAYRSGNPEARSIKTARDALKSKIDEINPLYPVARSVYAGDAALKESLEEGEKFLNRSTRQVHEFVRDLGEGEKEAYLTGAVEAMREKIGRTRSGEMGGFKFLEQSNATEKLRAMLPKGREGDRAIAQLKRDLMRERTLKETENALLRNSQTALRDAMARAVTGGASLPTGPEVLSQPVRTGIERMVSKFTRALERERQPTIDALADMLFKPGQVGYVIEEMQRRGVPDDVVTRYLNRFAIGSASLAPAAGIGAGEMVE